MSSDTAPALPNGPDPNARRHRFVMDLMVTLALALLFAFAMASFAADFERNYGCGRAGPSENCDTTLWSNWHYFAIHFVNAMLVVPALIGFIRLRGMKRAAFIGVTMCLWLFPLIVLQATMDHNPMGEFCEPVGKDSGEGIWLYAQLSGDGPCRIAWHHWLFYLLLPLIMVSPLVYTAMFWLSQSRPARPT